MSLIQGIFSKRYRDPHQLAVYQDFIIERSENDLKSTAKDHIKELEKFDTLMISFGGLNPVARNNLAIRQYLLLAALHFIVNPDKNDAEKTKKYKQKADDIFKSLTHEFVYAEGYSYFLYVESAYNFYWNYVTQYFAGNVSKGTIIEVHKRFGLFASPSAQLPFGDYRGEKIRDYYIPVEVQNGTFKRSASDNFLVWRSINVKEPEKSVYILVNKSEFFENAKWNGHINNEFGNVCVYAQNDWVLGFPFYTGWGEKQKLLKEPHGFFMNVPVDDLMDREPLWRKIKRFVKTETEYDYYVQLDKIKIHRSVIFDPDDKKLTITDVGGDHSFYNLGPSFPKIIWSINPGCAVVMKGNKLKLTGKTRILTLWLQER